ncbi:hypothetical protein AURDEDRAFT_158418 [Auricularia subglabra TFB-10046 SS5]|nr:hypothetical protein AURDEDRAFT_158418 [Auricularia subglabra TFB-10046 SS5]
MQTPPLTPPPHTPLLTARVNVTVPASVAQQGQWHYVTLGTHVSAAIGWDGRPVLLIKPAPGVATDDHTVDGLPEPLRLPNPADQWLQLPVEHCRPAEYATHARDEGPYHGQPADQHTALFEPPPVANTMSQGADHSGDGDASQHVGEAITDQQHQTEDRESRAASPTTAKLEREATILRIMQKVYHPDLVCDPEELDELYNYLLSVE